VLPDLAIHIGEQPLVEGNRLAQALFDRSGVRHSQAILLGHQARHDLAPTQHQFIEQLLLRIGQRTRLGLDRLSKKSQHARIQPIRLGQNPLGFRKIAHLARI